MRLTGKLGPQEFWARIDEGEARVRAEAGALPLFGVDGWTGPRMTGDWSWENNRLVSAGLAHGDRQGGGAFIQVLTTSDDPTQAVASRRMATRMPTIEPDQLPTVLGELHADPGTPALVTIEDEPREFRQWSDKSGWLAAGRHGEAGLVIEASVSVDITQLRLARVTDIEPYIAGRRARLRRLRGEDT